MNCERSLLKLVFEIERKIHETYWPVLSWRNQVRIQWSHKHSTSLPFQKMEGALGGGSANTQVLLSEKKFELQKVFLARSKEVKLENPD